MVTAIIMAGGGGTRAAQFVPKQFLTVNDTPVIVHTMKNIQSIAEIENIVVVGPADWEGFIYSYAKQFGISKLKKVVTGGETRHDSIYNGLRFLEGDQETEKVCLIDANRPLIPPRVIKDVIKLADECDCAMVLEPCYDSMFLSGDGVEVSDNIKRTTLFKQAGPECARLDTLLALYRDINTENANELSTAGLAVSCGKKVLAAKGHIKCFKITTADDFDLFKAFLDAEARSNIIREDIK